MALISISLSARHAVWTFDELAQAQTRVGFHLSYALAGRLLGAALGAVLGVVADGLVDAFCRRADVLHDRR